MGTIRSKSSPKEEEPLYYLKRLNVKELNVTETLAVHLEERGEYPVLKLYSQNLSSNELKGVISDELSLPKQRISLSFSFPRIGKRIWPDHLREMDGPDLSQTITCYATLRTKSDNLLSSIKTWREYPLLDENNKILKASFMGLTVRERVSRWKSLEIKFLIEEPKMKAKLLNIGKYLEGKAFLNLYGHSEYYTSWLSLVPRILKGMRLELPTEYIQRLIYRRLRDLPLNLEVKRGDRFRDTLARISPFLKSDVFPAFRKMIWNWFISELTFSPKLSYRLPLEDSNLFILERYPLLRSKPDNIKPLMDFPSPSASYDKEKWETLSRLMGKMGMDISFLTITFEDKPLFPLEKRRTWFRVGGVMVNLLGDEAHLKVRMPIWGSEEAFLMGLVQIFGSNKSVRGE